MQKDVLLPENLRVLNWKVMRGMGSLDTHMHKEMCFLLKHMLGAVTICISRMDSFTQ
jgi:hypothetical protein